MDSINSTKNIIPIVNQWNNIFNAAPGDELYCRVRTITLTRHPRIQFNCQLTWTIEFWTSMDDVNVLPPTLLSILNDDGSTRSSFSMDLLVTPKDQDGLGLLFLMVRTQLECNLNRLGLQTQTSAFTYTDICNSRLGDGISYLVTSNKDLPNRHVINFEHRKTFSIDPSTNSLIQTFEGMMLHVEGSGCVEVPIKYAYNGMVLLYSALELLYDNNPIIVNIVKNNQVIGNAYKS